MSRPAALGAVVVVQSLDYADLVLTELSYLAFRSNEITGAMQQKIDAIKTEAAEQLVVTVEGQKVAIADRVVALETALKEWIPGNAVLFKDDKKSIELAHGRIGLRQKPLAIEIEDKKTEKDVVMAINDVTKGKRGVAGWIDGTFARLCTLVKGYGPISDFLKFEISLNKSGIKKAYQAMRVKKDALAAIHLKVTEATDAPYVEPANHVVVPE